MNGEPLLIAAAGSGSAMVAGIHIYERRRDEAMRKGRVRMGLRFPAGLDPLRAFAAMQGVSGLPPVNELVFEVTADERSVRHSLRVPEAVRSAVTSTLTGAIPSLRITEGEARYGRVTLAVRWFVTTPGVLSTDNATEVSRSLLNGLVGLRQGEQVVIRWALRPGLPRRWQPNPEPNARQREVEKAWRRKIAGPGFRAAGMISVRADTIARARELVAHFDSLIRSRRGLVGEVRPTYDRGNRSLGSLPKVTRTSGWLTVAELVPLLGFPLGSDVPAGVEVGATRTLLVPREIPRSGIRLLVGQDAGGDREVALSPEAAKHHTLVVGATGSGKSWLLANAALSAVEQGLGGVAFDAKGDTIEDILRRVRPQDAGRIVVLDPADRTRPTPGLSIATAGDPDLQADVLAGAIRSAFPAHAWGVRTSFYLTLALRTLAEVPGATLVDVSRLFFDEGFLRAAMGRLRDPYLISAWQGYQALSAAARAEHVAAPMNRVASLLARPQIRAVVAARGPKLDIGQLFSQRRFLLVNLAPGVLGEAGSTVLGSVLMYAAWSAVEQRISVPASERGTVLLLIDELATLVHGTPFAFELLAERARGLGAGLLVSIQTLGRIPEPIRGALLGNAASLIALRPSAQEAALLAHQLPGLTEADLIGLPRFEVAARLGTGVGAGSVVITGRTTPLPPETGMADTIRNASAQRYGSLPESAPTSNEANDPGGDEPGIGRAGRDQ